jgi:hypothetical protein
MHAQVGATPLLGSYVEVISSPRLERPPPKGKALTRDTALLSWLLAFYWSCWFGIALLHAGEALVVVGSGACQVVKMPAVSPANRGQRGSYTPTHRDG